VYSICYAFDRLVNCYDPVGFFKKFLQHVWPCSRSGYAKILTSGISRIESARLDKDVLSPLPIHKKAGLVFFSIPGACVFTINIDRNNAANIAVYG